MKTVKRATFDKAIREGRYEAVSDETRAGYVEIRRPNGKREMIQVVG